MNSDWNQYQDELTSDDEKTRDRAATFVGNCGADAAPILPILMEMISDKLHSPPNHQSGGFQYGEFVSAGRILQAIEVLRQSGTATKTMLKYADAAIERLPLLLRDAGGESTSLLIYVLSLIGPRMAHLAPLVLEATLRESDPRMRYRAYQFACAVSPSLLNNHPWSTFPPLDPEERGTWIQGIPWVVLICFLLLTGLEFVPRLTTSNDVEYKLPVPALPQEAKRPTELSQKIDSWLDSRVHHLDAVMVQHRGQLVYSRMFNWFRADQPHEFQSATKTISSILIGIAIDEGLIRSVDQPIAGLLPEHAGLLTGAKSQITLYHALTMQTGLRWIDFGVGNSFERIETSPDSVAFVLSEPLDSAPGEKFFYNTGSSHLLSAILQRQAGMNALEYAKRRLFEPLGVTQVSWPALPDGRTQGGWGMYLSPEDMLKIGQLLAEGGKYRGKQIISKQYVDEMFTSRVTTYLDADYGYQLWFPKDHGCDGLAAARGYGGQDIFVARDRDLVVVFTGNIGFPERNAKDVRQLLKEVIFPNFSP
ncbi:MAG: beta-lactamase family protein [Planctomycetes bacterium]|nr:beta-lactamase family protein [Planctomycetota bacterium]